ncbi:DUF2169 family type VI secretion system accessory protein [Sorangium sp. So ce513]|uniref:DUF2169 family type VI secretion system accessory protein n=1 Tax=Sorangium sp. So ce513 TaxID=3133315 RepID=UPI003F62CD6C
MSGAAATSVAWRRGGQLQLTVIVKASFAFAADAEMPRVEPQKIVHGEVHHGNHPGRSVRLTSDLAPHLERADVLFTGHAHAPPPGAPVHSLPVRLAISDEDGVLLDKQLLVQDRAGFQRMPIVYERALRGENEQENFLGVAATGDPSDPEANILDPLQPGRAAGFGPIARAWPARRRLLGSTPRKALDAAIAEIPDAFDWAYYQAAPPDQRMRYLRGGEWIELHGLHPTLPRLRMRLPEVRGRARIHGLSAFGVSEGQPLDLNADTLRIDGDEQRCTVVFRGSFPVPDEAALAAASIVAGVEIAGEPLEWPEAPPQRGAAAHAAGRAGDAAGGARGGADDAGALGATVADASGAGGRTVSLPDAAAATAALAWAAAAVTPFRAGPAPEIIAGPAAGAEATGPRLSTGTLALTAEGAPAPSPMTTLALLPEQDGSAAEQPALPFQPAPPGAPPPIARAPVPPDERMSSGTLALPADDDWETAAAAPGSAGSAALAAAPEHAPPRAEAAEIPSVPQPELLAPLEPLPAKPLAPPESSPPEPLAPLELLPAEPLAPPELSPAEPLAPPELSPAEPLAPLEPPPAPRVVISASPAPAPEPEAPRAAPPPRPAPPPERPALPTPSPALRRSLYERFDRKR